MRTVSSCPFQNPGRDDSNSGYPSDPAVTAGFGRLPAVMRSACTASADARAAIRLGLRARASAIASLSDNFDGIGIGLNCAYAVPAKTTHENQASAAVLNR